MVRRRRNFVTRNLDFALCNVSEKVKTTDLSRQGVEKKTWRKKRGEKKNVEIECESFAKFWR